MALQGRTKAKVLYNFQYKVRKRSWNFYFIKFKRFLNTFSMYFRKTNTFS